MKYILIIMILKIDAASIGTVEFRSKLACEHAARTIHQLDLKKDDSFRSWDSIVTICAPDPGKGKEK